MNQNFSSDQLLKLCKESEIVESGIPKPALATLINEAFAKIADGSYSFNLIATDEFYMADNLVDKLILRKINDNLKRLYKDSQSNRRVIVNQVSVLLHDTCSFWVLRTDISSFYESVDRSRLLEKLQNDSMLSYFSLWLIKKLFAHPLLANQSGLPRGVALSSTLSELYMRRFDRWAKVHEGVYYYARFVDDIIIFCNSERLINDLNQNIGNNLDKGLSKNEKKTSIHNGSQINEKRPLNYLGYKFTCQAISKKEKKVSISIADKKVKKIKSRIVYSIMDFINKNQFDLLHNRIKFLTGNYSIKSRIDGHDLRAGIHYNYISINDLNAPIFDELNIFLQKILNSKNKSFGTKLAAVLTPQQKAILSKYSFKHGFRNKVYHAFKYAELKQISSCWK